MTTRDTRTEMVKEAYAAINRNDIPALVDALDPQIEWTEPTEYPMGGTYRGHEELKPHLTEARNTWAEGSCEPERLIIAGDSVVALIHVRVKLKNSIEWIDAHLADVFTFRGDRIVRFQSFGDAQQAFEWAGVDASAAD